MSTSKELSLAHKVLTYHLRHAFCVDRVCAGVNSYGYWDAFFDVKSYVVTSGIDLSGYPTSLGSMLQRLLLVVLCMVFARSAMAFNRYLDRSFDAQNPRTAIREIPAGILKADRVLLFTIVNSLLFVVRTWFINRICFFLAPVALFVILFYSYTKRFTPLCHLVLGVGLSLAPIGAFLAVTGFFALLPILFSFAVVFWVSGLISSMLCRMKNSTVPINCVLFHPGWVKQKLAGIGIVAFAKCNLCDCCRLLRRISLVVLDRHRCIWRNADLSAFDREAQ